MKKIFRYFLYFLGGLAALVLAFAAWVQLTPLPTYEPKSLSVQSPIDSASLALGKKIVENDCTHCHLGEDGKLSGRLFSPASGPFGEVWSRNITQHPQKGIGTYTDGQLAYLFRTGIKRNGEWAGPYMTSPILSDGDLAAVIAYLRSNAPLVQASELDPPPPKYSFLAKALIKAGLFKPIFRDIKPVSAPPMTDKIAYGRYLTTAAFACYRCHSAAFETNDDFEPEKSKGYLGGGNPVEDHEFHPAASANLTMSQESGLGKWTKEQFAYTVRTGVRPDERVLSQAMPRFGTLSDPEIDAIWAYLQTVPILEKGALVAQQK